MFRTTAESRGWTKPNKVERQHLRLKWLPRHVRSLDGGRGPRLAQSLNTVDSGNDLL